MSYTISDAQFVLDQIRFASNFHIHREIGLDLIESEAKHRVVRLEAYVLADKPVRTPYETTVRWSTPATPWQHFKQAHRHGRFLGWLARRFPVVMDHHSERVAIEVESRMTFPNAEIYPQELGRPVLYEQARRLWD